MSGQVYSEPFAQVPEWVLDADVSDRAIRVFALLHRHADKAGQAFPGRTKLAARARCSTASLDRALNELREIGAIHSRHRTENGGVIGNDYWLWPATPPSSRVMTPSVTGEATPGRVGEATLASPVTQQEEREPVNESHKNESQLVSVVASDDKAKRASSFPEHFFISQDMRAWAQTKVPTVDVIAQTEQFCDYHRAKGDRAKDWVASWRTWMRNAVTFGHRNAHRKTRTEEALAANPGAAAVLAERYAARYATPDVKEITQ